MATQKKGGLSGAIILIQVQLRILFFFKVIQKGVNINIMELQINT